MFYVLFIQTSFGVYCVLCTFYTNVVWSVLCFMYFLYKRRLVCTVFYVLFIQTSFGVYCVLCTFYTNVVWCVLCFMYFFLNRCAL